MLGWMTKADALKEGFTHYGSYFGIPVYMSDPDGEDFMVAAKHSWLEPLMTLFHYVEGFIASTFYPDAEPSFLFLVKGELAHKEAA